MFACVRRAVGKDEILASHRQVVGRRILHYDALESTNDAAKEFLDEDLEDGLVVWADRQAAGRGRHGRAWASPPGGLYFSMVLRPPSADAQVLGLVMGLPLVQTLRHFGVLAGLKWPNDAVYQGRKIGGILSEGVHRGGAFFVVVGVGVNTNVDLERLPPDVREKATTMKREVSLFVANEDFLDYYLGKADEWYSRYRHTPSPFLVREVRGQCVTIGKRVSVESPRGRIVGRGHDLAPSGALIVIDDSGTRHEILDGTVEHLT